MGKKSIPDLKAIQQKSRGFEYLFTRRESPLKKFQIFCQGSRKRGLIEVNRILRTADADEDLQTIYQEQQPTCLDLKSLNFEIQNKVLQQQESIHDQSMKNKCEINMDLRMFSDHSLSDLSVVSQSQSRILADNINTLKNDQVRQSLSRLFDWNLENLDCSVVGEIHKINEIRTKSRNNNIAQYIYSEVMSPKLINGSIDIKPNNLNPMKTHQYVARNADYILFKTHKFSEPQKIQQHNLDFEVDDFEVCE